MTGEQSLLPGFETPDSGPKVEVDIEAVAAAIAKVADVRRKSGIVPTPERTPSEAEEDQRGLPLDPAALEEIRRQSLAQGETEVADTTLDGPELARAALKAARAKHTS